MSTSGLEAYLFRAGDGPGEVRRLLKVHWKKPALPGSDQIRSCFGPAKVPLSCFVVSYPVDITEIKRRHSSRLSPL